MKFMTVAIIPTIDAAPSFLTHQTVRTRTAKPTKSHKSGKPVILKNMGAKIEFITPHNAANNAMAATSRLVKYGINIPSVLRKLQNVIRRIKGFLENSKLKFIKCVC